MIRNCAMLVSAGLAVAAPLAAMSAPHTRKTLGDLELRFTRTLAGAVPALSGEMMSQPVSFSILDKRVGDPSFLGERTDDDDEIYRTQARNAVGPFFEMVVGVLTTEWGVGQIENAPVRLEISLLHLRLMETNLAVGATFEAIARVGVKLHRADGALLWSGSSAGDATRYGKKFSDKNCNEVLSDALVEALAEAFSDPGLHRAWAGEPTAPGGAETTGDSSDAFTPEQLLSEILRLSNGGLEEETLEGYVKGLTLTRRLTAADIQQWKTLQIPETVIRAALQCSVE